MGLDDEEEAEAERGSNYYFMQHRNVVFANDFADGIKGEEKEEEDVEEMFLSPVVSQSTRWIL